MKQGGVFLMEKTMSVEEKIKRAEEIYNRRKQNRKITRKWTNKRCKTIKKTYYTNNNLWNNIWNILYYTKQ